MILALALLMITGSAFAAGRNQLVAAPDATFQFGVIPFGGTAPATTGPTTTNNDDTCDIGTAPAATLLLPYFAVNPTGLNTIFTITNTSATPQVAHVTVWTDWSFPVLDFNVYLTGYDVQPLSLRDIIFNGVINPVTGAANGGGTTDSGSTTTGTGLSPRNPNTAATNPNFVFTPGVTGSPCRNLPGNYGPSLATAVQNALINGTYVIPGVAQSCASNQQVGSAASTAASSTHPAGTAIGYVTVDVANTCSTSLPIDPAYFFGEILYDNVLTGDYEIFDSSQASNYAGGNPLVHIRAVPEGGAANVLPSTGSAQSTNLPYTFYSRYAQNPGFPSATRDRRQPLPSTFAARYIQGGGLSTSYRIWREGFTTGSGGTDLIGCATAEDNSAISISEIVRFDEHENTQVFSTTGNVSPSTPTGITTAETGTYPVTAAPGGSQIFPGGTFPSNDVGGWMYLNLDVTRAGSSSQGALVTPNTANPALYASTTYPGGRPTQNWVVVSMTASGPTAGAFAVDFDATWLGNGCSPTAAQSQFNGGLANSLGPRPNANP